ncbi:transketolase [Aestuariimicrobium sp. T2.26MG-19.2B]|uniref:transketolase n=1 Tax=Aestuariimicrobium sp. T2.26MG-19.2B TaxID=3040679 RepID=UPI0024774467|nr:transketolase [Aestuariimicrobium sp. T2.26MG-19.2B]CAI9400240.1 Transketolase [Aestuariimicrobium sp. T2.26MG-19.2B]
MASLEWTEQDERAVDTARILAADAVEKVGNGHPGTAISLAPAAYLLFQRIMNWDVNDDQWLGRDRFVLSAGHASLTQYCQLYLANAGLTLDDLKSLRTWGSKTPGHPEYHHTKFVETTTGPLGAGVSNAVGFAMAARRERGMFDPDAPAGESVFDRQIYAIAGDGCMQEGISSEASSLAATQDLGNLTLIYDDNRISIEGDTKIAFSEDVAARYAAYGWHVQHVDWTHGGTEYHEDVQALYDAIEAAKAVTDRPSFIRLTTIIGWPLPNKAGSHDVHGSKLGADEISGLKQELGFTDEPFAVDRAAVQHAVDHAAARSKQVRAAWDEKFAAWQQANPERAALLTRIRNHELPEITLAEFPAGKKKATRAASGEVLNQLASQVPELWGGSADLASSNNTTMKGEESFLPVERASKQFPGNPYGRTLHFGIREHAMGGIVNGIALSGLTRPYGGTFLVFSDYMRPAVRLAALMGAPSIFVWTHDSVGVGGDGPTHQPIEHVASLRLIPGLDVVRPGDANEVSVAWKQALAHRDRPTALILSRQDLAVFDRTKEGFAPADQAARGAYVLKEASAAPQLILIATGSEVELAVGAAESLEGQGIPTRVVSMPCQEWFDGQDEEYRESVLPSGVTARLSIEAGVGNGWQKYVGAHGASLSIESFGASADGAKIFEELGFTVENVVTLAQSLLS